MNWYFNEREKYLIVKISVHFNLMLIFDILDKNNGISTIDLMNIT